MQEDREKTVTIKVNPEGIEIAGDEEIVRLVATTIKGIVENHSYEEGMEIIKKIIENHGGTVKMMMH